jgi:hypothetical protein
MRMQGSSSVAADTFDSTPKRGARPGRFVALAMWLCLAPACQKPGNDSAADKAASAPPPSMPASCAWDEECKDARYICAFGKCQVGKRTPDEVAFLEAERKRQAEEAVKKAEEERPPGPNEGRLLIRICSFVRKTGQFTGHITAVGADGKTHTLEMEKVLEPGQIKSEFAFRRLPVGEYDVRVDYGVRVLDKRDVTQLKCDKKAKPCSKDGFVRKMTVVPVAQEVPPKIGEDGKPEKKPCDFQAE